MGDEWLAPPMACGKRPRSPVDKLADLAACAEDEEQDWRSSKRYLTEVIASGFSKLSFKLGMPPHQQQLDPAAAAAPQLLQLQQQSSISPKTSSWLLPGQLGAQPLQVPEAADCPLGPQESPPIWPPQSQGQQQHKPAFAAGPSPPGALAAAGVAGGSAWGGAQHECFAGQTAAAVPPLPQGVFFAGRRTPSPEPCGIGGPCTAVAAVGEASPVAPLSPAAAASAASAESSGLAADDAASRAGLPPLQTSKVLRAAEKQPNSPSDLPASSLRKVALLRSLLARAEQQFHQQQGGATAQQQQQQGSGVPAHQSQPTRMQQASAPQQQQQQPEQPELLQQQQQQQQETCEAEANCRPPWMQPWGVLPGSSRAHGGQQPQQQQQQQLPVLPPRPVTPWDMSSDDMDCSSASSAVESDASSSQQGPLDPSGGLPQLVGVDQDQAASALLCREVLFPAAAGEEGGSMVAQGPPTSAGVLPHAQQQQAQEQEQRGYGSRTRQHNMQLPFFNQAPVEPAPGPLIGPAHQQQPQHQGCGASGHPPLPPQQQQQQHPARRSSMHHAPRQGSPELSAQRLEELRARALASTHQLTCLTQEDLHSLQLGLASRRGSVDSSSHAPSGLQPGVQQQQKTAPVPPALRRHSSHI